jgi:hypothetical protein
MKHDNSLNDTYRFVYSIGNDLIEIKPHKRNVNSFNRRKGFETSKGIANKGGSSSLLSIVEQNQPNSLWLSLQGKTSQHLMDRTFFSIKKANQLNESIQLTEHFGSFTRKYQLDLMR